jgi:hypothetical protein
MSDLNNERFYPAAPDAVWNALKGAVIKLGWTVKSHDEFTKAASVSTPMSGFSWGATLGIQVVPAEGGAIVRVGGAQKVRMNVTAKGPEYKNTIKLLDKVSAVLQEG